MKRFMEKMMNHSIHRSFPVIKRMSVKANDVLLSAHAMFDIIPAAPLILLYFGTFNIPANVDAFRSATRRYIMAVKRT